MKKVDTDVPTTDEVRVYIKTSPMPACPTSGTYSIRAMNADPTCSLSGTLSHTLPPP